MPAATATTVNAARATRRAADRAGAALLHSLLGSPRRSLRRGAFSLHDDRQDPQAMNGKLLLIDDDTRLTAMVSD